MAKVLNSKFVESQFISRAMGEPQVYTQDLARVQEAVKVSKAIYKGKPIPFLYVPKFFTSEDLEAFSGLLDRMMAICHHMIHLYRTEVLVQEKYGFDQRLHALIMKDSPYASKVPMGRYDIFYNGPGNFKFCELNTDGTSAMNEDRELARMLGDSALMESFEGEFDMHSFELFDTWVREVDSIYRESGGTKDKPRVAIVDFFDKASAIEFEVFKERFEALGYPCVIADARNLSYEDGQGLMYEGLKIDVVYRRLVTMDMMSRIDEIPAFERACLDDITLVIGNIQSQVVHTKLFFALLFDPEIRPFFTEDDLAFIDRHVPHTVTLSQGLAEYDLDDLVAGKDGYLIKPLDFYASIGVYAGKDVAPDVWRELLLEHGDKPYLLQSFCEPPISENIDMVEGEMKIGQYKHITGLYVYNRKLFGVYSRAGRTAIISGLHDVFTLPSIHVKEI